MEAECSRAVGHCGERDVHPHTPLTHRPTHKTEGGERMEREMRRDEINWMKSTLY